MNKKCIENIGIASTDGAPKLNNTAIIVEFKPLIKFEKASLFPSIAIIADIHYNIFFFLQKCFNDVCDSYSNALVRWDGFRFSWSKVKFKIKAEDFGR